MLWRARSAQVRSKLAPPGFIQPSRPALSKKPPGDELWVSARFSRLALSFCPNWYMISCLRSMLVLQSSLTVAQQETT
jgi:hypothetical protein